MGMRGFSASALVILFSVYIFFSGENPMAKAADMLENVKETPASPVKVRLLFAAGEAVVEMNDSPSARSFTAQMPVTLKFQDYNRTEKIAYPPERLSCAGAPAGFTPSAGDLALYAPWGNLALFYKSFGYSPGLILLGRVVSGLEKIAAMQGDFTVRAELAGK